MIFKQILKKLAAFFLILISPNIFAQNYINLVHSGVSDYVPIFIAKKENLFEKNNIFINLKHLPSSTSYAPGLISNSFQIATLNPPAFLQAIDAGIDLVAISTGGIVMERDAKYLGLIAKDGSNINSAKDLVGKKIGINAVNGIFQVMVREWLKANQVNPKDVIFIEGPLHQLGDILKAGNVDAVATIDPFMGRIMKDGGYKVLS
jgi:NitT/TauT family transport system substrate-binding protein